MGVHGPADAEAIVPLFSEKRTRMPANIEYSSAAAASAAAFAASAAAFAASAAAFSASIAALASDVSALAVSARSICVMVNESMRSSSASPAPSVPGDSDSFALLSAQRRAGTDKCGTMSARSDGNMPRSTNCAIRPCSSSVVAAAAMCLCTTRSV
ncbi:MAG: hypothetical protein EOO65_02460 [Methanosarcinales archaeon]|nr:MAG: hypothetical protein EOO65_02460 [Methanosarcinales archaeon]